MCFYKTGNSKAIKPQLRTFFQVATYPSVCSNLPQCEESWKILNFKNYKMAILFKYVYGTHKREQKG